MKVTRQAKTSCCMFFFSIFICLFGLSILVAEKGSGRKLRCIELYLGPLYHENIQDGIGECHELERSLKEPGGGTAKDNCK